MVGVVINPGSGPVADSSETEAWINILAFVDDLGVEGLTVSAIPAQETGGWRLEQSKDDGRKGFYLDYGDKRLEVAMPGLVLERVRWMQEPGQDIWQFPRLYVDGSSWIWKYALSVTRSALTGEEED